MLKLVMVESREQVAEMGAVIEGSASEKAAWLVSLWVMGSERSWMWRRRGVIGDTERDEVEVRE